MAITKEHKQEVLSTYEDWFKRSQAIILVEYTGAKMKDMDAIRAKVRESGAEFHVVKNTLARRAFTQQGMPIPDEYLLKSTAVSFAFTDPAATAKALAEATKGMAFVKVKGGFMGGQMLNAAQVKALAELPPLPVKGRSVAEPVFEALGLAPQFLERSKTAEPANPSCSSQLVKGPATRHSSRICRHHLF